MKGEECPIEMPVEGFQGDFVALFQLLMRISKCGFSQLPNTISRQVNKKPAIYELRHGRLRFFYFHGKGNMVVICTESIVKKTTKANNSAVSRAITAYKEYQSAIKGSNIIEIREEKK